MNAEPNGNVWYALQVRTRWESSTSALLYGKGYQTFLPTYEGQKNGKGKSGDSCEALFPGYVFCQFDVHNRLPVLITPGVIAVVGIGRMPVPVEESEICALRQMVSSGFQIEPCPYLEVGRRVRIEEGALRGLEGILTVIRGSRRIVVSVSLLRRSVGLEIDRSSVRPIERVEVEPIGEFAALPEMDAVLV